MRAAPRLAAGRARAGAAPHPPSGPPLSEASALRGAASTPRMRVLIADDDRASRSRLKALVEQWSYEAELAENGAQAIRALASQNPPRLAIVDWVMPGIDGIKVCQYARQGAGAYVYLIVVTSRNAPEAAVEALRAGADDYVTKPFREQELEVRLRAGRRIVELEEGLRLAAREDPLTAIWGRAAIQAHLAQQLSKARRESSGVSVLVIDVDHFKRVNDGHGHAAGDAVLHEVAQRMRRTLRSYDGLGRLGGEEFLVVLPNSSHAGALAVGERIRRAIAETPIATPDAALRVTCSVGVASDVGGESSVDALIDRADEALYRAKRSGRDRVEGAPDPQPG